VLPRHDRSKDWTGSDGPLGDGEAVIASLAPGKVDLLGRSVPIFFFDQNGQQQEDNFPSFTYEIVDIQPRMAEYVFPAYTYGGENYNIPVDGSTRTITDSDGTEVTRPSLVKTRPVEQGYDFFVELRAYANDPIDSALLVQYLFTRFPPRHFLRVPMEDGSYRSWDMFQTAFQDLDKREAVREGSNGIMREYCKAVTLRVEGYLDNTNAAVYRNVVQRRVVSTTKTGDT